MKSIIIYNWYNYFTIGNHLNIIKYLKRSVNMLNSIEIYGHIADLKENDYKNTLAIVSIIELLIEKGVISKEDLSKKVRELDF
ncbi:MAG: hypothetical protein PWR27_1146 [Petroclostridium sp.]|jgi:hypothetical protein|nr:hypothetical protein [Clostridia bacterium]MDK2810437.1 hypothetical protein [Petroclostridium sp.]